MWRLLQACHSEVCMLTMVRPDRHKGFTNTCSVLERCLKCCCVCDCAAAGAAAGDDDEADEEQEGAAASQLGAAQPSTLPEDLQVDVWTNGVQQPSQMFHVT